MRSILVASALVVGAAFAVGAAVPGTAHARGTDLSKAKAHYKAAEAAMAAGKYADAAAEYGMAYEITKDPVLFFKIATADEKAGKCDLAVTYYRRYLKDGSPDAEYKKLTQERIVACGGKLEEPAKKPPADAKPTGTGAAGTGAAGKSTDILPPTEPAPTTEPAPPTEPAPTTEPVDETGAGLGPSLADEHPPWSKSAGWITVAVGAAAATVGAVLLTMADSSEQDIRDLIAYRDPTTHRPSTFEDATRDRYNELVDEGERFDTLAIVSFGVAGAAVIGATVFFVLAATEDEGAPAEHALRITPTISPDGAGLSAAFRF